VAQDFPPFADGVPPEVAELLAGRGAGLADLGTQLRETALVGIESVTGQRALLRGVSLGVTDPAAIDSEFRSIEHMGFEVRVTLAPGLSLPVAMLVSIADLSALLSLELTGDPADADAAAQAEAVASAMREFLDLISVALGGDALAGVEVSLASQRTGAIQETAELLAGASDGLSLVRVDLELEASGAPSHVVLIAPAALLDVLIGDEAAALPSPAFAGIGGDAGSTSQEDAPASNISPLRPVGGGASTSSDDVDVHPVRFPPLPEGRPTPLQSPRAFDLIMDVSMRVTVELGRSSMTVEEVLSLGPGSVVELNKLAGEPVDVLVNEQLIARGEVVVVDENFGVRVTEIVSPRRRVQAMGA
jgi:flagellar motor switch protein FliN/FliY